MTFQTNVNVCFEFICRSTTEHKSKLFYCFKLLSCLKLTQTSNWHTRLVICLFLFTLQETAYTHEPIMHTYLRTEALTRHTQIHTRDDGLWMYGISKYLACVCIYMRIYTMRIISRCCNRVVLTCTTFVWQLLRIRSREWTFFDRVLF